VVGAGKVPRRADCPGIEIKPGVGTVPLPDENIAGPWNCELKPSDRFVVSLTVPVSLDNLAIAPFLSDVASAD